MSYEEFKSGDIVVNTEDGFRHATKEEIEANTKLQVKFLSKFLKDFKKEKVKPASWLHKSTNIETGEVKYSIS